LLNIFEQDEALRSGIEKIAVSIAWYGTVERFFLKEKLQMEMSPETFKAI
jgi:hypothetical protein